ncbi:MAG: hypothetical protein JRH20_05010 [Deltaproteobacteria bacterium]|nr:hypothetical protein [Deltaproteobacteria bacterium]
MRAFLFVAISMFAATGCKGGEAEAPKAKAVEVKAPKAKEVVKANAPKAKKAVEAKAPIAKLVKLSVDDIKAVAIAAGYKVRKTRTLPVQLGIKTTAISLNKVTVVTLSHYPKDSAYNKPTTQPEIVSELREGDFVIAVRSPKGKAAARKTLLDALQVAANKK